MSRIEGSSEGTTTIRFDGDVPTNDLQDPWEIGVSDGAPGTDIDFESISLAYNGPSTDSGTLVWDQTGGSHWIFNNVTLDSENLGALFFQSGDHVTVTNSTIKGGGLVFFQCK